MKTIQSTPFNPIANMPEAFSTILCQRRDNWTRTLKAYLETKENTLQPQKTGHQTNLEDICDLEHILQVGKLVHYCSNHIAVKVLEDCERTRTATKEKDENDLEIRQRVWMKETIREALDNWDRNRRGEKEEERKDKEGQEAARKVSSLYFSTEFCTLTNLKVLRLL